MNHAYKAYAEESILNSSPIGLVVALYEGAIDSCAVARKCLVSRDIEGRTKAVNKVINILTELLRTLDDEKGGEVSRNLRRLYPYVIARVTEAHVKQIAGPLEECERLLSTVLEGWKGANQSQQSEPALSYSASFTATAPSPTAQDSDSSPTGYYASYLGESSEYIGTPAYSF